MIARLAVALDTDDWTTFEGWCRLFGPRVEALKVGLEAFIGWGPQVVETARDAGASRVFLDLKLHDIPNTVAGAVRAARATGADLLTVHVAGGRPMLEAAVEAAQGEIGILGVTVLTHLDRQTLAELDLGGAAEERVGRWAALAERCGCAGVVCSPLEAGRLRAAHSAPFLLVTPGIRPRSSAADDQRRIATPAAALEEGSDLLVIGRPLTRAADPIAALDNLEQEMQGKSVG